jgi:hypothetical protein
MVYSYKSLTEDQIILIGKIFLCVYQGSPHLQKIGRLDFSLREHEGEVKA